MHCLLLVATRLDYASERDKFHDILRSTSYFTISNNCSFFIKNVSEQSFSLRSSCKSKDWVRTSEGHKGAGPRGHHVYFPRVYLLHVNFLACISFT